MDLLGGKEIDELLSEKRKVIDVPFKWRWIQLILLSCASCLQSMVWITLASLQSSSNQMYQLSERESQFWMNLLAASGPIMSILVVPFMTDLLEKRGLRITLIAGISLTLSGSLLRLLAEDRSKLYLVVIGQFLNAAAYPFVFSSSSRLSAVWFPEHQRNLATAIGALSQNFGTTAAFALAALAQSLFTNSVVLYRVYQFEAFLSIFCFICIIVCFQDDPLSLPSLSISKRGTRSLIRKCILEPGFIYVTFASAISVSLWIQWMSSFDLMLSPQGLSDEKISLLASISTLVGIMGGVCGASLVDKSGLSLKPVLIVLCLLTSLSGLWFALSVHSPNLLSLYLSSCTIGTFSGTAFPLMYQYAVQVSEPIPEGISSGILTFTTNIFLGIFFLLYALTPIQELLLSYLHSLSWCVAFALYTYHYHVFIKWKRIP